MLVLTNITITQDEIFTDRCSIPPIIPIREFESLSIEDQLPDCEIYINMPSYSFREIIRKKRVIDIGCGFNANKDIVEAEDGIWVGIEAFKGVCPL